MTTTSMIDRDLEAKEARAKEAARQEAEKAKAEAYLPDWLSGVLAGVEIPDESTMSPADIAREYGQVLVAQHQEGTETERAAAWVKADNIAALVGIYERHGLNKQAAYEAFGGNTDRNKVAATTARLLDPEHRLPDQSMAWHTDIVKIARRTYRDPVFAPDGYGPNASPQKRGAWESLKRHVDTVVETYAGSPRPVLAEVIKNLDAARAGAPKAEVTSGEADVEHKEAKRKNYTEHVVKAKVDTSRVFWRKSDGTRGPKANLDDLVARQIGVTMGEIEVLIRVPNQPEPVPAEQEQLPDPESLETDDNNEVE